MSGRALVFSNHEVARIVTNQFVPYAGDQWYLHRQKDAAGEFFWKVVQQGHYGQRPMDQTRQGVYAATPDGELLGALNNRSPERNLAMLTSALEQWRERPKAEVRIAALDADEQYSRTPPQGGLILKSFTRIPLPAGTDDEWGPNRATGRDHVWLTREEWRSLLPSDWKTGVEYPVPPAVAERLVRFHLLDNVRGEPDMWRPEHVREAKLTLRVADAAKGRLELAGTARMQAPANGRATDRGYDARLQGALEYDRNGERFRRFDLLSWGEAWGHGTYTGRAPAGRFPLVIAFSLAGNTPTDRIPPQAIRHREEYWGSRRASR